MPLRRLAVVAAVISCVLSLLLAWPRPHAPRAQGVDVFVNVTGSGARKLNIAIPEFTVIAGADTGGMGKLLASPFRFTKGLRTLRTPGGAWVNPSATGTLLYDLEADPGQARPVRDGAAERRMTDHLVRLMRENDAPPEQFVRLGLS